MPTLNDKIRNIKFNTVLACGFLGCSVGALVEGSKVAQEYKDKPIVEVRSIPNGQEKNDPRTLTTLFFAGVAAICGKKLADKEDSNDKRKAMDRFMANMRDGLRVR